MKQVEHIIGNFQDPKKCILQRLEELMDNSPDPKKADVLKQVGNILNESPSFKEKRKRNDKWNYYLIAYDLFTERYNYDSISQILTIAFEKENTIEEAMKKTKEQRIKDRRKLFDVRNIENYHKEALRLINGGYKEYLNFTE